MLELCQRIINNRLMKMDLRELKRQINLDKKNWQYILSTNCYAYALGLDIPERKIKTFAYAPGTIGNARANLVRQRIFTYDELINNINDDLFYLGINFMECTPDEKTTKDEWKIALFTSYYAYMLLGDYYCDFHFLRERKNGIWYHKKGYFHRPNNLDSNKNIITDPRECYIKNYDYQLTYKLSIK